MAEITLKDIKKYFGSVEVLHDINLTIPDKKLTVFVGPSGCGKSTLLRLISGLEFPTSGSIFIEKRCMNNVPPAKRNLAMVFQSYALYPHMTVYENMAFGLRLSQHNKSEIKKKIEEVSKILHIDLLLNRKPKQLSGGQQQRVAIGRALVRNPEVYLFDEPLSNIDATLRVKMRTELAKLKADLQKTMVYVTHDQVEAMTLADQIVVLNHGCIEQIGDPLTLYNSPTNKFVANFIGSPQMNFLSIKKIGVQKENHSLHLGKNLSINIDIKNIDLQNLSEIGIRPEHMTILSSKKESHLSGIVHIVEHLGSETYVDITLSKDISVLVRAPGTKIFEPREKVGINIDKNHLHFFNKEGKSINKLASFKENISTGTAK